MMGTVSSEVDQRSRRPEMDDVDVDVAAVRRAYGATPAPKLTCNCKSRLFYLQPDLFLRMVIPICASCGAPQG